MTQLPCGCLHQDGVFYLVSKAEINTENLFVKPGRFISVDGSVHPDRFRRVERPKNETGN